MECPSCSIPSLVPAFQAYRDINEMSQEPSLGLVVAITEVAAGIEVLSLVHHVLNLVIRAHRIGGHRESYLSRTSTQVQGSYQVLGQQRNSRLKAYIRAEGVIKSALLICIL